MVARKGRSLDWSIQRGFPQDHRTLLRLRVTPVAFVYTTDSPKYKCGIESAQQTRSTSSADRRFAGKVGAPESEIGQLGRQCGPPSAF